MAINAKILETKRVLLGDEKRELTLEEREDGGWNLKIGNGTGGAVHVFAPGLATDQPADSLLLDELLYKAAMFDHMVRHLHDQGTLAGNNKLSTNLYGTYMEIGLCTQSLSDEALEAMALEFQGQNYSPDTLGDIAEWAQEIIALRRQKRAQPSPQPPGTVLGV